MAVIEAVHGVYPNIDATAFLAQNATVLGDVEIGESASIWFGAVLRGDVGKIQIGRRTNIQDLCMVHCTSNHSNTIIGADVTVGHRAILHGCIVEDECLVGMGAILMDNAVVQKHVIVAAGAVVLENQVLDSGFLYAGTPAKKIKEISSAQMAAFKEHAVHYVQTADEYRKATASISG